MRRLRGLKARARRAVLALGRRLPAPVKRCLKSARRRRTPTDRETASFVRHHARDLRGRVLELREPRYTRAFGHDVSTIDVLDVDPRNHVVTVLAALDDEASLPPETYDCVLLIDALRDVRDVRSALTNAWSAVAPGGVLLLTVLEGATLPEGSNVREGALASAGSAGLGSADLEEVLRSACPGADREVMPFGRLTTARVVRRVAP